MKQADFERFMAGVRATAYIEPPTAVPTVRKQKRHRITRKAEALAEEQLEQLLALLSGSAALINIHGVPYTVKAVDGGYAVKSTVPDSEEYIASKDSCTCPDSKFRGHVCKHIEAVRKL